MKMKTIFFTGILIFFSIFAFTSCAPKTNQRENEIQKEQEELFYLLTNEQNDESSQYAIIKKISKNLIELKDYQELVLFLTDWVSKNPKDPYNAYWLYMTGHAYKAMNANPIAEYYFDRVLKEYNDLTVQGQSVHFICLQHLIQISKNTGSRIRYFNQLISRFPANVSITELYLRLALEYEKQNEWEEVLKAYTLFLAQPDASTIQIAGLPNAYKKARQLVAFHNSKKDWTFESLDSLETAVKKAIRNYSWRDLDKYKAKVNFFSMSWKQDEIDPNSQEEFSMKSFMRGNKVRYNKELDSSSNSKEAYLKTWGWSQYVSVWYLYFRKVNYPVDPDIHGNWEWAGIYLGERM